MRTFFTFLNRPDGTVDIFLDPRVYPITVDGRTDYDVTFRVVRGVDPAEYGGKLEDHVREHFRDWCDLAETIWL